MKQWLARLQKKWALPCPQLSHKTTLHSSPLCQLMVSETGERLMRYSSILYHCKCSLATPQSRQWTIAWTCSAITHTYILCPGTVMVELLGNIEHTVFASIVPNRQYSSCLLSLYVNVVHCIILDSMELEIVNLYTEISPIHVDIPDIKAMQLCTHLLTSYFQLLFLSKLVTVWEQGSILQYCTSAKH